MDEEEKARLTSAAKMLREERRFYNQALHAYVKGDSDEYNAEDLMRLVGQLEAAYNHVLAAIAADGDIYCVLKHLSYAIVLAGEMDEPNVSALYDIMSVVTNGRIEACSSCKREEDE